MKTKINLIFALAVLMLTLLGWNQSSFSSTSVTISDLKFSTSKDAVPQSDIFCPNDVIYIVSEVRNTSSEHKIKVFLHNADKSSEKPGVIVTNCEEIEVTGETPFNCSVSSENKRFPSGRYKAVAVLFNEDGTREIDRKEGIFEIIDGYSW
jgi:DNA-binding transcriptional regulator of glucitol operon